MRNVSYRISFKARAKNGILEDYLFQDQRFVVPLPLK